MKGAIHIGIVLMALVLFFWGIFFPISKEYVIQNVLGLFCCGVGLGMGLEKM